MGNEDKLKIFASLDTDDDRSAIRECITKIMNTLSFRKLAGKTQVILSLSGPDIRTRLTHTIEVAKIAKDICYKLGLNEDLAEAIALAHDIGHTPFGHVGEKTLREIMCGCDTLGGKVNDYDFKNSGFKHNLQSFRVLHDIEKIIPEEEGNNNIWPYILWGVVAHTKMSYSEPYEGMENEILISAKHCPWVYSCYFDEKHKCKFNFINNNAEKGPDDEKICKPWFCSVITEKDGRIEDKNVDCKKTCYMAKLWGHKIEGADRFSKFPYFFDHPFPNSFYVENIFTYFIEKGVENFISVESQIVSQADEIAQRQQDLEDGISKGLIRFEEAKEQVQNLVEKFTENHEIVQRLQALKICIGNKIVSFKTIRKHIKAISEDFQDNYEITSLLDDLKEILKNDIKNSDFLEEAKGQVERLISQFQNKDEIGKIMQNIKESNYPQKLGELLVRFYKKILVKNTEKNFDNFSNSFPENTEDREMNIYCLMNIVYSMDKNKDKKRKQWIEKELKRISTNVRINDSFNNEFINKYFEINTDKSYFYCFVYDYLNKFIKKGKNFDEMIDIFLTYLDCLRQDYNTPDIQRMEKVEDIHEPKNYYIILMLDKIKGLLKKKEAVYNDFFKNEKKKYWKRITGLNLMPFFASYLIYINYVKEEKTGAFCIGDMRNIDEKEFEHHPEYNRKRVFVDWARVLKQDASPILSNLVNFTCEKDLSQDEFKKSLNDFEEIQKSTILKSEIVEKNDGKAGYILRRLFKAYITNPHQMPNESLTRILSSLEEEDIGKKLVDEEKEIFFKNLIDLSMTLLGNSESKIEKLISKTNKNWLEMSECDLTQLKEGFSHEIRALIDSTFKLNTFLKRIKNNGNSQEKVRSFRAIIDNPLLNAIPYWKSILTRGICDYIAGMTDQEAINEYEKLYAGIMELA